MAKLTAMFPYIIVFTVDYAAPLDPVSIIDAPVQNIEQGKVTICIHLPDKISFDQSQWYDHVATFALNEKLLVEELNFESIRIL